MDTNQIEQEFSFLNLGKEEHKLFTETIKTKIESLTKDILYYAKSIFLALERHGNRLSDSSQFNSK